MQNFSHYWQTILTRTSLVRALESVQDLIVVSLCVGLFCAMVIQLRAMFLSMLPPIHLQEVTADILYVLILVELFRLLIIYLQEHRVSIGVAVEVAIVSVLREVLVRGVLEVSWNQILATCAFLIVMALLLIVRVWLPPTFNGIDPEGHVSRKYQLSQDKLAMDGHQLQTEQNPKNGSLKHEGLNSSRYG
jgi:uncharacterized membrane protein (DUF373 family)